MLKGINENEGIVFVKNDFVLFWFNIYEIINKLKILFKFKFYCILLG